MVDCWFCQLRNLKPTRNKTNLETGERTIIRGNLNYAIDRNGERVPVCNDCAEDIRYGNIPNYKMVIN